jgi:hypothetical protein
MLPGREERARTIGSLISLAASIEKKTCTILLCFALLINLSNTFHMLNDIAPGVRSPWAPGEDCSGTRCRWQSMARCL